MIYNIEQGQAMGYQGSPRRLLVYDEMRERPERESAFDVLGRNDAEDRAAAKDLEDLFGVEEGLAGAFKKTIGGDD